MIPLLTLVRLRLAFFQASFGLTPARASRVRQDISLYWAGGNPKSTRIFRASVSLLILSDNLLYRGVNPYETFPLALHSLAKFNNFFQRRQWHGTQFGGAHLGVAVYAPEIVVQKTAAI